MKRDRALAYAAFAVVCIVWGTTYLGIRVAVRTIPPFLMTGFRFTIAGLILFALARLRGEEMPRIRKTLVEIAIVGLLLIGLGNFAVAWSEQWVPSGIAALLVATAPFWAAVLERLRRPVRPRWASTCAYRPPARHVPARRPLLQPSV